jgi:hypothetical protein
MKDKVTIALAILAAFSMDVAANADGMVPEKKISHKRSYRAKKQVSSQPQLIKETTITTTKTIEKPVVIEAPAAPVAPVAEATTVEQTVTQPAVCETATPVIIDRYEKRRRSLIHLGLFPFSLFGD